MVCLTKDEVLRLSDAISKMAACADHVFLLSFPWCRIRLEEQTWHNKYNKIWLQIIWYLKKAWNNENSTPILFHVVCNIKANKMKGKCLLWFSYKPAPLDLPRLLCFSLKYVNGQLSGRPDVWAACLVNASLMAFKLFSTTMRLENKRAKHLEKSQINYFIWLLSEFFLCDPPPPYYKA